MVEELRKKLAGTQEPIVRVEVVVGVSPVEVQHPLRGLVVPVEIGHVAVTVTVQQNVQDTIYATTL